MSGSRARLSRLGFLPRTHSLDVIGCRGYISRDEPELVQRHSFLCSVKGKFSFRPQTEQAEIGRTAHVTDKVKQRFGLLASHTVSSRSKDRARQKETGLPARTPRPRQFVVSPFSPADLPWPNTCRPARGTFPSSFPDPGSLQRRPPLAGNASRPRASSSWPPANRLRRVIWLLGT